MLQLRDRGPVSARARRMAWCLVAAIIWVVALLLPDLDWRVAGLLVGVAVVGGVGSDLTTKDDPTTTDFGSNVAAILMVAGLIVLARLLVAL